VDQAILALLGVIITLMLYLDRSRRADTALLRQETQAGLAQMETRMDNGLAQMETRMDKGLAQMETRMDKGLAQVREEVRLGDTQTREEMQRGFAYLHERIDKLTEAVLGLARRVGRLEGRAEAASVSAQTSQ